MVRSLICLELFELQMKPISLHWGARDQVSSKSTEPVSLRLKGGGCPVGTVPIRRITKGDLIRERLASTITSLEDNSPGTHVCYPNRFACALLFCQHK